MREVIEQTLIVLKPDAVKRGLVGSIISRFETTGFKLMAAKMVMPKPEVIKKHYPGTKEWLTGMGEKTLASFQKSNLDVKKTLGTDDPQKLGRIVYDRLIKYWQEGPIIVTVWQGPHAIEITRKIRGHTVPFLSDPGTIHSAYSFDSGVLSSKLKRVVKTFIHASGDKAEAKREIKYWFGTVKFKNYRRDIDELYLV